MEVPLLQTFWHVSEVREHIQHLSLSYIVCQLYIVEVFTVLIHTTKGP